MPPSIQLLDDALLDSLVARAAASPRLRSNHNFHQAPVDNPHRFLNALVRGTYCPPHRHQTVPKDESFVVLRGELAAFIFDDTGQIAEVHSLGERGLRGIDIAAGFWHTIAALSPTAVCYEVKPGPWDPRVDKELAPWAPLEGQPGAAEYAEYLMRAAQDYASQATGGISVR